MILAWPVTKLDNSNTTTPKNFYSEVMLENCDVTVILPIYGEFGVIRKPDSGRMVCKIFIFINSNLLKGMFSETTYMCVLKYQISSF